MQLEQQLSAVVGKWDLLKNPFYEAWSAGTLPVAALQDYASEYGNFIGRLSQGWETLHDQETAEEETEHAELWQTFAKSIQAKISAAKLPATKKLLATAQTLFAAPATAMGAMYAFEVQQPKTASSKLLGLRTHYSQLQADENYFEIHSHNEHESEKLLKMMYSLDEKEQEKAISACATMCEALWDALAALDKAA